MPGKLASLMNSADISTLNMERVISMMVIDGGYNDLSHRRQLAVDNQRSKEEIAFDNCLAETLTLCGCQSSVVSVWATPITSQIRFVAKFMEALAHKYSLVKSVQLASSSKEIISAAPLADEVNKRKKTEQSQQSPNNVPSSSSVAVSKKASAESISTSLSRSVVDELSPSSSMKWLRYARVVYGLGGIVYSPE